MFTKDIRGACPVTISPSVQFNLDPRFAGTAMVAGDLTGNGKLDLLTARNHDQSITAIAAYTMAGEVLWTWGTPGEGSSRSTYDIPLQIQDINVDGRNEVIFCADRAFIVLDGTSGKEMARYPLPPGLEVIDCITFGNLQGHEKTRAPPDIIIKDRYTTMWAFSADWTMLWKYRHRLGWKLCHHPTLLDIDGDGKDEVLAGLEMLDHDGKPTWSIRSPRLWWNHVTRNGHLDSARVLREASQPRDSRIAITYCGARFIGVIDGHGRVIWSRTGHHYESIDVGRFSSTCPSPQLFVDIDHRPFGKACSQFIDANGIITGEILLDYGRQHRCGTWGEENFGLIFEGSNPYKPAPYANDTFKPSGYAYKALAHNLNWSKYIPKGVRLAQAIPSSNKLETFYFLKSNGDIVLVMWNGNGEMPVNVSFTVPSTGIEAFSAPSYKAGDARNYSCVATADGLFVEARVGFYPFIFVFSMNGTAPVTIVLNTSITVLDASMLFIVPALVVVAVIAFARRLQCSKKRI